MNVELLKRVATKLKRMRHKKHFDMHDWIQKNECGTAACVAGHALLLTGHTLEVRGDQNIVRSPKGRIVDPEIAATRLLKLSPNQAQRLFVACNWPREFGGAEGDFWSNNAARRKYNSPKVAAARIGHFIATHGKE